MFTGIVESVGTVVGVEKFTDDLSISVNVGDLPLEDVSIGDSIAVSGCCLTVVTISEDVLRFDVSIETVDRTLLGSLDSGHPVNLEKAMAATDRLGGHLVSGHVDGLAELSSSHDDGRSTRMQFMISRDLGRYIAEKGSVTLDGVSLTVNDVVDAREGTIFGVNLVPHTLSVTTLGKLVPGGQVHLEVDIIARYLERLTAAD